LSEYYRTDEEYIGSSLVDLIEDLKKYKMFISKNKQVGYQEFIDKISNPQIFKISVEVIKLVFCYSTKACLS